MIPRSLCLKTCKERGAVGAQGVQVRRAQDGEVEEGEEMTGVRTGDSRETEKEKRN